MKSDLCLACHQGIIEGNLASHNGFSADGCWTAGCHNFHHPPHCILKNTELIQTYFVQTHLE
ncbi:MAG: hypothetical protein WBA13_00625 [Microcoleaceae cyanobacterium]